MGNLRNWRQLVYIVITFIWNSSENICIVLEELFCPKMPRNHLTDINFGHHTDVQNLYTCTCSCAIAYIKPPWSEWSVVSMACYLIKPEEILKNLIIVRGPVSLCIHWQSSSLRIRPSYSDILLAMQLSFTVSVLEFPAHGECPIEHVCLRFIKQ